MRRPLTLTFGGKALTGQWPETCPNGHSLSWAEVPGREEPYLVCTEPACQYEANCDGPTWTAWHEAFTPIEPRPRPRRRLVFRMTKAPEEANEEKVTEHSDLGLPPGIWPDEIIAEGVRYVRGALTRDAEGDLMYAEYQDEAHNVLRVFND